MVWHACCVKQMNYHLSMTMLNSSEMHIGRDVGCNALCIRVLRMQMRFLPIIVGVLMLDA